MPDRSLDVALQDLRQVRMALLRLHKALLFSERAVYEQFHDRIQTSSEFFQLVVNHEWFGWLRPMSQFIVQMDDVLNAKDPVSLEQVEALLREAQGLIQPSEDGSSPEKRLFQAVQRDPDIALLRAEIADLLQKVSATVKES